MKEHKKNIDGLENVNVVIGKVVKKLGIEKGIREATLINLWKDFIDEKYVNSSKAISIVHKLNGDVLLVAVSSSIVSQEMFLKKSIILKKMAPVAHSLELNIVEILFSTKLWDEVLKNFYSESKKEGVTDFFIKNPSDNELRDIVLPENIISFIRNNISKQQFSSSEFKDRLMNTIIRDLKIQIWRKNNGFPFCEKCGIPINYITRGKNNLCPACRHN